MRIPDEAIDWNSADRPLFNGALFTGTVVESYEDDSVATEVEYRNGLRNGWMRIYFPDGRVEEERHYVGGARNGPSRTFYPSGAKKSEAVFVDIPRPNTLLHRTTWDENGIATT